MHSAGANSCWSLSYNNVLAMQAIYVTIFSAKFPPLDSVGAHTFNSILSICIGNMCSQVCKTSNTAVIKGQKPVVTGTDEALALVSLGKG